MLKEYQTFINVVQQGSITKTSEILDIPPSTVSKRISKLEKALNVKLLKKNTHYVGVTEAGKVLYENIIDVPKIIDNALLELNKTCENSKSLLKITCSIAFGLYQFINIYSKYQKLFKSNLQLDLNDNLINLNESDYNIAIRITQNPPETIIANKICDINWILCASPEYLKNNKKIVSLDDIQFHTLLINTNIDKIWDLLDENILKKNNTTLHVNSSIAVLHAALKNLGLAYLPVYMVDEYFSNKQLVPILENKTLANYNYGLYVMYHPCYANNIILKDFISFFKKEMLSSLPSQNL